MGTFVIAYDVGTTGIKTCLFEIDKEIRLVESAMCGYNLYVSKTAVPSRTQTNGGTQCALRQKLFSKNPT